MLESDFKYGRDRKRPEKVGRHPLNLVFDPFYPMIIVTLSVAAAVWYFDIPIQRVIDFDVGHFVQKLIR